MTKFHLIIIVVLLAVSSICHGQSRQDIEELYKDANAYFYFEDYEEALSHYLNIYDSYPDNYNLDYRIGLCYLNVEGNKNKAIPYLERAARNISKRYNENSLRETMAPIDALFYLGNAYFINNQLDRAKESYDNFLAEIKKTQDYNMDYFDHQMEGLERSKVIQRYPINFVRSNLGQNINNRFPNYNAVISGDGNTLAYTTKERFYQAILVARKEGDNWGRPQNITLDLVVDGNCSTLSLSFDGKELYLFKDEDLDGNIWVSNFENDRWTPMRRLNENINTQSYETNACVSADGKKLYFSSNRPGGYGDLDIYVSEKDANNNWGPAKNLGSNINTSFNESSPFLTNDGTTLFFSSEGHNNMGGYDIFFSQKQADGTWSKPVNLGYPINTTDDNIFYFPINDGSLGLISVFDPKGYGEKDITQIEIFLPKYQRNVVSSSEFFTRVTEHTSKTLVVDTVNVTGLALLDPSRPEHMKYIEDNTQYTLFFDGKPYEIKDQAKLKQSLSAKLTPKQTYQIDKLSYKPTITFETNQDSTLTSDSDSIEIIMDQTIKPIETRTAKLESIPIDSVQTIQENITKIKTLNIPTKESQQLSELLMSFASPATKEHLSKPLSQNWQLPSEMLMIQALHLVNLADSTGITLDLIGIYSKLLDIVSTKSVEGKHRLSRQISQSSFDEDFFFRLQQIKRMASPGLAELLDEAILTQPQISSFSTLWKYLNDEKKDQIAPFINEFLELLITSSVNNYFDLAQAQRNEISDTFKKEQSPISGFILAIILSLIGFITFILLLRRRRKKK